MIIEPPPHSTYRRKPLFTGLHNAGACGVKYLMGAHLLANRVPPAAGNNSDVDPSFTIPVPNGNPIVIPAMPQFLVTRGTAYCLLPSIATLQQLAGMAK